MGWITATALFLQISVQMGTPILFGTLGGILGEKTGNLNLGVEGMMYMGGAMGLGGAFYYEMMTGGNTNGLVAVLIAILFAFLGARSGPSSTASSPSRSGPTRMSRVWPWPSLAPARGSSSASICA